MVRSVVLALLPLLAWTSTAPGWAGELEATTLLAGVVSRPGAVAWSPDGERLAVIRRGKVQIVPAAEDGSPMRTRGWLAMRPRAIDDALLVPDFRDPPALPARVQLVEVDLAIGRAKCSSA